MTVTEHFGLAVGDDTELVAGVATSANMRTRTPLGYSRAAGAAPAHVATHLLAVRPRGDAAVVAPLLAAANQASSQGAPDAATTYLARALAEPPSRELRTQVLLELGVARARTHPEQAIAHLSGRSN